MKSSIARAQELYESVGYLCDIVERQYSFPRGKTRISFRRDFLGFGDLYAIGDADYSDVIIQATEGKGNGNHNARIRKIMAEPKSIEAMMRGKEIHIVSWNPLRRITRLYLAGDLLACGELDLPTGPLTKKEKKIKGRNPREAARAEGGRGDSSLGIEIDG